MKLPRVPSRIGPGFAFSIVNRAIRECLSDKKFGQKEINEVLTFFDMNPPECVFCGSPDVKRWDHLVPIKKDGETVLGNMVPACAHCDDFKGKNLFEEWMISEVKGSPKNRGVKDVKKRLEQIKAYKKHYGYTPRRLEKRLDKNELKMLTKIRSGIQELREDIDEVIKHYKDRQTELNKKKKRSNF